MTARSILEQIQAIKEVTAKASVSKEAAAEFLTNAGIPIIGNTASGSAQSAALPHSPQHKR